jgi:putative DNA methylase
MRQRLTAIVAHGPHGRIYLPPNSYHESTAASATPTDAPIGDLPEKALGFRVQAYGMKRFADLYNNRQTVTLTALCGLVVSVCALVHEHGVDAGLIEKDAASRASAIATYLSFVLSKLADLSNALNRWEPVAQCPRNLFTRQAVPMVWDTAEGNPLGTSSGSWLRCLSNEISGLTSAPMQMITPMPGHASQCDARELKELLVKPIVSTDPPYYDNVPYADLSDFFYVWLRRSLGVSYPDLFSTILVPKAEELVSDPFRHGGKDEARKFFEEGTRTTFGRIRDISSESFPVSIYYAFSISPITPGNVACLAEISDRLTLCIR